MRRNRLPEASAIALLLALAAGLGACRAVETWRLLRDPDPRVLYEVDTSRRLVALTLDDGPDPETTPRILATLARHEAQATFFLIGERIEGQEALVARIAEAGHELGNHHRRDFPSIELTPERFEAELLETEAQLATWQSPRWFRPASGWWAPWMLEVLERHGYGCALGSIYPLDAQLASSWLATRWIRWQAQPGAVVVLHDGGGRGLRTVRTLEAVLPALRQRGFRVVSLSRLVELAGGGAADAAK